MLLRLLQALLTMFGSSEGHQFYTIFSSGAWFLGILVCCLL